MLESVSSKLKLIPIVYKKLFRDAPSVSMGTFLTKVKDPLAKN